MTVKVKKTETILGKKTAVSVYLPIGFNLNAERRERADALYSRLSNMVDGVNESFEKLPDDIKKNDFKKWKWLGDQLVNMLQVLLGEKSLEQADIDNHAIWPGIGQFFRPELSRGMFTKRSGVKKDHYRKCWLLATVPSTNWIKTWTGWDAFVDRGEQLVASNRIMPLLEQILKDVKLKKSDYQDLAREIAGELPSVGQSATISAMSDSDLKSIVEGVCDRVLRGNSSYLFKR